jgi:DNA-binding response OmpR family regulator
VPTGRLLVVDDEPEITSLVEEHFGSLGWDVDVAHDGAPALVQAAARRPDVVLLDVTMPGVSGDEVLDRLRAIDRTVPIVMLTGNADEELARAFLRRGAFDYVAKPFQLGQLESVVSAALAFGGR